jgi:hypothetical protein
MGRPPRSSGESLSPTDIVARKDGLKLYEARFVGLLQAAKGVVVEIARVSGVAVAICYDAAVNASCVAVPDVHVCGRHRLASRSVDDLYVENQRSALLAITDVTADQLTTDIVRAFGDFWLKDARRVVGEEILRSGCEANARMARVM